MRLSLAGALALGVIMSVGTAANAEAPGDPKAVKSVVLQRFSRADVFIDERFVDQLPQRFGSL